MKINYAYPFLITLILFNTNIYCQNSTSDMTADNNLLSEESIITPPKVQDFIQRFDIVASNVEMAKILGEVNVYSDPGLKPAYKIFEIYSGSLVETYKFYPKEAVWAIHYNGRWGFVSAAQLIPYHELVPDSSEQHYDVPPKRLNEIQLNYPAEAKSNGIYGKVYLRILISKTGSVDQATVIKGNNELDDAAIEAVKKLRFKPGKYLGKPVEAWINFCVHFEL